MRHSGLRCKLCGDEIYSLGRHDYVECSCGNCSVDGGFDYLKISYKEEDSFDFIEGDLDEISSSRDIGNA